MKKSIAGAIALLALGAVTLTGCNSGGSPDSDERAGGSDSRLYERTITLTDGRTVTCVKYITGYAGGVSCDWDGASR